MSLLDEKKERPLQLIRDVLSIFLLALTVILQLFGLWETLPLLIRSIIWIGIGSVILFLMIPRTVRWAQVRRYHYAEGKRQDAVLGQLKVLVDELSNLFKPHQTPSLVQYVEDLSNKYKQAPEIYSKLKTVGKMLRMLDPSLALYRKLLQRPGRIRKEYGFQRLIFDFNRFNHLLGDAIREFKAVDLNCESAPVRDQESECITKSNYNHYIDSLEEIMRSAQRIHDELPTGGFPRLQLE